MDPVLQGVPGGEEEHGPGVAPLPHLLGEGEPRILPFWQHHVQDEKVRLGLQEGGPGLLQAPGPNRLVPLPRQEKQEGLGNVRLVL